jgi:hypothetical protein
MSGAACAAVERARMLDSMTDDFASAVSTGGSQSVNRTLKGVEGVSSSIHRYGERLVVVITAYIALRHG